MRKLMMILGLLLVTNLVVSAQYNYDRPADRYHYDEDFDWRWDARVRISDGQNNGSLTNREARRLYRKLERIERCEYDFQSDGYYSGREQDEIWEDVQDLNRSIGLELNDWDRTYYGFSRPGYAYRGYSNWYDRNNYDFYRFDKRGFGSITFGYRNRFYVPQQNRSYGYHYNKNRNNHDRDFDRNGRNNRNDDRNREGRNNRNEKDWDKNRRGDSNPSYGSSRGERDRSGREESTINTNPERGNRGRDEVQAPRENRSAGREEILTPRENRSSGRETRGEEIQTPRESRGSGRESRGNNEVQTPRESGGSSRGESRREEIQTPRSTRENNAGRTNDTESRGGKGRRGNEF
jgi:hypothetical protein